MANPATPAADPADEAPDAPEAAMPDEGAGASAEPTVLCTIMANSDGSYSLVAGDETEAGESGAEGGGAPAEGEGSEPDQQGTQYTSVGALLKGVLDLCKQHEEASGGGAEENFQAGFSGGSAASPPRAMAQKY